MITSNEFISLVRDLILTRVENEKFSHYTGAQDLTSFMVGKMLRTRMASQLITEGAPVSVYVVTHACAAVELVHTASLFHDDVIDSGQVRRGKPTLWKATSTPRAILLGDVLFCEAIDLLLNVPGHYLHSFVEKIQEVCLTETEQEIISRGEKLSIEACLDIARGKTGPLFAFASYVCGGEDSALSAALEEAGYLLGTAYQLADDIIDVVGDENMYGKSLRNDERQGKYTIAQSLDINYNKIYNLIDDHCLSAVQCLDGWPGMQNALRQFVEDDFRGVFSPVGLSADKNY